MRNAQTRMTQLLKRTKDCKLYIAIIILMAIVVALLSWVLRSNRR
jgi:hypothetical protein